MDAAGEPRPEDVERLAPVGMAAPALFGFISGMDHEGFLAYALRHREHAVVRRVFFSEIGKRTDLPVDAVDAAAAELLALITQGTDRAKSETLLRRLIPGISMQMRTRTVRVVLTAGTKPMRSNVLRQVTPLAAPGIEADVLDQALIHRSEDALVGIVYRWPVDLWRSRAVELFEAADAHPWLQRQIIFKTEQPDAFLDRGLIRDPVTELYVRARYGRPASDDLIGAAIETANAEDPQSYENSQRSGLVAWCLGRLRALDRLPELTCGWGGVG